MKCDHKICKVEEASIYITGMTNWKEAFESVEKAYDKLYDNHRTLRREHGNLQIEKLRVCRERNQLEIKCDKLEVQRNNWKDLTCMFAVGFVAICITFIFYVLTHY